MNGNIENVEMKLQDLYGAVKIAAVMANGSEGEIRKSMFFKVPRRSNHVLPKWKQL